MTPAGDTLKRFGALSFTYFAAIGLFNPYAPLWFQSLGISTLGIGAISSLQSWTRVAAPYAWGTLGDRTGRRVRLIRIAAAGALLSALGLLGLRAAVPVALATAMLFVANGGVVPLSEASLARLLNVGGSIDTARYGRVRVWGSIGFISAVAVFGALLQMTGVAYFPWFVAGMNGLLLGAALRLPTGAEGAQPQGPAPSVLARLRQPPVAWFFASVGCTVLAHTSLYAFLSLYLVHLGHNKATVGVLWAVAAGAEIVFFWFQGRWFPSLVPQRWLQVAALVTAGRFALMAGGGPWLWALVVAQLSHAITFAAHHSAAIALIHKHFPDRLRARGQALYTVLGYGIPGVLGGVGGGWLIERWGFEAMFGAAAVAALLGLACARLAALPLAPAQTPGGVN